MNPLAAIEGVAAASMPTPAAITPAKTTDDSAFANSITGAIDELRSLQSESDSLKIAAVTGDLDDIHSAMIASSRAAVTLELVAAVRNKGVDAFNEIMRMQA
ncbi:MULTISPECIES: flagellar hook-basal body complex protein FliE [unclassified Microbacterium]|uniref:flagellar hook-basal body complex protein FliE n=1 Tax=unclassified Microbacterium TaxID=2609290 RepID=UPI000EA84913|nr:MULTISPECIES: flagellar hook-basal body complex protein FliE [unclassified Microbacterium]MBT2485049.1 flagellar hook-basal body complex protein FliE [Microbacterium sp. ISL-108]RKN67896.1 flagellar hook-basal body complex protein FliE [Microbacterium sp. CGR2]